MPRRCSFKLELDYPQPLAGVDVTSMTPAEVYGIAALPPPAGSATSHHTTRTRLIPVAKQGNRDFGSSRFGGERYQT